MIRTSRSRWTAGAVALVATAGLAFGGPLAANAGGFSSGSAAHTDKHGLFFGRSLGPLISGVPTPGSTITAALPSSLETKGAVVTAIQWSVDGVVVDGATGASFAVGDLAPGTVVGVTLTIQLADGTVKERTSRTVVQSVFAVAGAPVVSATGSEVGATLSVDPTSAGFSPEPEGYVVVWLRDGVPIARGLTYVTVAEDAGLVITAKVVAYRELTVPASAVSAAVVVTAPVIEAPPAEPSVPAPADPSTDPGTEPVKDDAWKQRHGECDNDRDGWADGDRDRDGRVDSTGTWWGVPAGWIGDSGSRSDDGGRDGGEGDRGDRGGDGGKGDRGGKGGHGGHGGRDR